MRLIVRHRLPFLEGVNMKSLLSCGSKLKKDEIEEEEIQFPFMRGFFVLSSKRSPFQAKNWGFHQTEKKPLLKYQLVEF